MRNVSKQMQNSIPTEFGVAPTLAIASGAGFQETQLFRVYNTDINMLGKPVFYCRHIFYDLLDYFIKDTRSTEDGALEISRILDGTPFTGASNRPVSRWIVNPKAEIKKRYLSSLLSCELTKFLFATRYIK